MTAQCVATGAMEKAPLVSVIMNCYNGERYLREAIDSVFAQTYDNWEIIFFDNASSDGSEAIARSYGNKLRYFRNGQTIPLGAARNAAIAHARGELIAFLDTDDRWLPEKLEWQVSAFQNSPQTDFVYSNYYMLDAASGRATPGLSRMQPEGDVFGAFLRHYPVNLQTVMVRSSALQGLDVLFDPALEMAEEYDLFMRLLYSSKAGYLQQPTAFYRVHGNMLSIRHIDKYPPEMDYILGKLRRLSPDFDRRYSGGVRYMEAKIGYWYAAAHMHKGDCAQARISLAPHKWISPVFLVLYLATYLPLTVWGALQKLRGMAR